MSAGIKSYEKAGPFWPLFIEELAATPRISSSGRFTLEGGRPARPRPFCLLAAEAGSRAWSAEVGVIRRKSAGIRPFGRRFARSSDLRNSLARAGIARWAVTCRRTAACAAPLLPFHQLAGRAPSEQTTPSRVCTENLIRVDAVMESPKLAE